MYILIMPNGLYVQKGNGTNNFVRDPRDATQFPDKESADNAKPGHHRDMGGTGFKGRIILAAPVIADYRRRHHG